MIQYTVHPLTKLSQLRADINKVCLRFVHMKIQQKEEEQSVADKRTSKEQMIKTYGKRGVCRSTCMEFPVASMRLQLHNRKANPNH